MDYWHWTTEMDHWSAGIDLECWTAGMDMDYRTTGTDHWTAANYGPLDSAANYEPLDCLNGPLNYWNGILSDSHADNFTERHHPTSLTDPAPPREATTPHWDGTGSLDLLM